MIYYNVYFFYFVSLNNLPPEILLQSTTSEVVFGSEILPSWSYFDIPYLLTGENRGKNVRKTGICNALRFILFKIFVLCVYCNSSKNNSRDLNISSNTYGRDIIF